MSGKSVMCVFRHRLCSIGCYSSKERLSLTSSTSHRWRWASN